MTKLIIIIPAFNEESSIARVITTIPKMANIDCNVVVIDDGSSDKTGILAQEHGAKVLKNKTHLGLGRVIKLGMARGIEENSDIMAILDGDGQYEASVLKKLVSAISDKKCDLIMGNRFMREGYFDSSILKRIGNRLISMIISKLLLRLKTVYDIQSSIRAFNKDFAEFILNKIQADYNYAQEMFILASLNNFKINQIPVKCKKRTSGKSRLIKNPFIHIIRILWISLKTRIKNSA
ncbi:MAG: glycosyltransferase family 2 protein [Promethearchaeota archaeon]|nr:MAG: glycosyltransferase family 2 protein [Candidatus Lokiarchaeota archaeon]